MFGFVYASQSVDWRTFLVHPHGTMGGVIKSPLFFPSPRHGLEPFLTREKILAKWRCMQTVHWNNNFYSINSSIQSQGCPRPYVIQALKEPFNSLVHNAIVKKTPELWTFKMTIGNAPAVIKISHTSFSSRLDT